MTPVYFGSALRNFGVGDLLEGLGKFAPPPRAAGFKICARSSSEPRMSAFVFKIQANMDPNHRDRIASPGCVGQADARHEGEAGSHRQEHDL